MKKPKFKRSSTIYKLTISFLRRLLKDRVAKRIALKGTNSEAEKIVVRQITAIHQLINEIRLDPDSHKIQRNLSPLDDDSITVWYIDKYKDFVEQMIKEYKNNSELI